MTDFRSMLAGQLAGLTAPSAIKQGILANPVALAPRPLPPRWFGGALPTGTAADQPWAVGAGGAIEHPDAPAGPIGTQPPGSGIGAPPGSVLIQNPIPNSPGLPPSPNPYPIAPGVTPVPQPTPPPAPIPNPTPIPMPIPTPHPLPATLPKPKASAAGKGIMGTGTGNAGHK